MPIVPLLQEAAFDPETTHILTTAFNKAWDRFKSSGSALADDACAPSTLGLLAKPAGIITRRQNDRHAVVDVGDQLIGIRGDDRKGPNPFARSRLFPVLPNAGDAERCAIFHGDRVGLLRPLALDRLPLEEAVHRHDAAALAVGIPKGRQVPDGLALGI